ncbi:type VI secretion system baseplate subunit TssE [Thiorhodovibrio winogradskyi]|uniref:type VI secretion system baseplate subunit TssE n=1 Tax=Thiorhodovibrio winogradskyi TaxID=77007 RepID=UPI0038B5579D
MEHQPDWRGATDPKNATASILSHLAKILNCRQGSVPIAPDFGIPDFTGVLGTFDEGAWPEVEDAIGKVIAKYEPRLVNVAVRHEIKADSPFEVAFQLAATIRLDGRESPILFEAVLNSDGRIEVME